MTADDAYRELVQLSRDETVLASVLDLLEWDEETYMPRGGVANRSAQAALLAAMLHDRGTDPRIEELLCAVEDSALVADRDSIVAVNVRELRREYERARKIPRSLVEESARVTSLAQQVWADARKSDDFPSFRPWLERIIDLARQEAECVGHNGVAYDALLDGYEPGVTTAQLTQLFDALRADLVALLDRLMGTSRPFPRRIFDRDFSLARQRLFAEEVARAVGFDLERGRADTAVHPFCSSLGPGDCRLGLRFRAGDFREGFFGVLHEVGHGLYEQGLDAEHYGTPMGEAASLGVHESQSRLWENLVGRGRPFWDHFFPRACEHFREPLRGVSLDEFYLAINRVEPTTIRAHADEVTYNLHVLVRFELEQALIAGDLAVSDVPEAWTESYRRHLGITPRTDAEGCLQDGHWADGLIGYFPTYTLGNVYGAQLFERARTELPELERGFARGEFAGLLDWLRRNVYRHGRRYHPGRLIEETTGAPPDPRALIAALRRKYGELSAL